MTQSDFAILRNDAAVPDRLTWGIVAIGNFDGVHRGHRAVLDRAVSRAHDAGLPALALTFEPHPRTFFRPETPVFRLTPSPVKAELLAGLGLDAMVEMTFDAPLAGLPPEEFVSRILVDRLEVSGAVVGHDFHFGRARAGTPALLTELGREHGFSVDIVAPAGEGDEIFSSSDVRAHLAAGRIEEAAAILGYDWYVRDEVIHGDKRGRELLGFPTANLRLAPECELRHGVYAVRVGIDGRSHDGVASYGRRPQFDNGAPLLEVYVLDFSGDLYGREIHVTFISFLRPEARFDSVEALIEQMHADTRAARAKLAAA